MPLLTVYSGRPDIDVLQAEPQVLATLPGMTADRLHTILAQRGAILAQRGADPLNDQAVSELVGSARGASLGNASKATRVLVEIDFDNGRRVRADVVVLPLEDGDEPFRVFYWQDDFDALD
jgi:general secretion pathway protein K